MTVPTISNLPTVPATSDPNFETEAPALFNHIKNTFVSEMNSAISFINSSTFDATVEFKNADFTAARNFLYMIDTSSGGVSVTLPANPSTGDQLLLMDQKRSFGTNNLTIGRNSQNINGAASDVVSKSTGALIRCIFQASYGWTVDLYEGEWESGTNAGDLVYNGGNVGIGTSAPDSPLHVAGTNSGSDLIALNLTNKSTDDGTATAIRFTNSSITENFLSGEIAVMRQSDGSNDLRLNLKNSNSTPTYPRMLTIDGSTGNVGIGTSAPNKKLHVTDSNEIVATLTNSTNADATKTLLRFSQHTDADNVSGNIGINRLGANPGCGFEINLADSNGAEQNRLTILENGNVGIGTSAPSGKLDVNTGVMSGNVKIGNFDNVNNGNNTAQFGNGTKLEFIADTNPKYFQHDPYTVGYIKAEYSGSGADTTSGDTDLVFATYDGFAGTANGVLSEKMRITADGNVELSTGNLVIGTAGKGIDFSATSGTGTSELLDDYEEGTFTPTYSTTDVQFSAINYDTQNGSYTKIGRQVFFTLRLQTSSITVGSANGTIRIGGLPFTPSSTSEIGRSAVHMTQCTGFAGDVPSSAFVFENQTYLYLRYRATSNGDDLGLAVSDMSTGSNGNQITLSGSYQV